MPPNLCFYVEPQKFSLYPITLARRIVRVGTEAALDSGFKEAIRSFVHMIDTNETRKKRENRLGAAILQRRDMLLAAGDHELYRELVRKCETSMSQWFQHYNSNPGLTHPNVYRAFVRNASDLSKERHGQISQNQEWEEMIESMEAIQDDLSTRGFQLVRTDNFNARSKRQEFILFPCADKFLVVQALDCSGIDNEPLIDFLRNLDSAYPFTLVACGKGLLEAKLSTRIEDAKDLARLVSEYSPQVLDYGTASLRELAREIERTQRFWLYFDAI